MAASCRVEGDDEMTNYSTMHRSVSVRVTREEKPHTGTRWVLFADYPNETEAREAAIRSLGMGNAHAEVIVTQRFSHPVE